MKLIRILITFALVILFPIDNRWNNSAVLSKSHQNLSQWILFKVRAVESSDNRQQVISETHIEGPAGVDFDIKLQDKKFSLTSDFNTDLLDAGKMKINAGFTTKRLVGVSKRGLPFYEEDEQKHSFEVSNDEIVELLPFGQNRLGSTLKIEIEYQLIDLVESANRDLEPLKIKIIKRSPEGLINVNARKIPHDFILFARLMLDGKEIASSSNRCRYRQPEEIKLQPAANNGNIAPLIISLNIADLIKSCPNDLLAINFDLLQRNKENKLSAIGKNWSGVSALGEDLEYRLNEIMPDIKGTPSLQLNFRLAETENPDHNK